MPTYLTSDHLHHALTLRDLSNPDEGHHAVQVLLEDVTAALSARWDVTVNTVRTPPLVAVRDNYDRLGYSPTDVTREARYSRYTSATTMLRSHTSADIPAALDTYGHHSAAQVDELIVVPGLAYRRDVVDRTHVGEPHQVDLWRLRSDSGTTVVDLEEMIAVLVTTALPGARWRTTAAVHPYTHHGRQVDVLHQGQWLELELAECGLIHPDVLTGAGLNPARWSGLALGMGLERAVMLRKNIPDIRYLRPGETRIAEQMHDLTRWRAVSMLPPIARDMSIVIDEQTPDELLGDRVRASLPDRLDDIESIEVLSRTPHDALPTQARDRLGLTRDQTNALVRLTLRPLDRTLTDHEANDLRNRVYLSLHEGPHNELA